MLKNSAVEQNQARGFTIVELLIVVVVIAILAAITIVSYNGIQNRAHDTTVQSDLRNYGIKINNYYSEFNSYPAANASNLGSLGLTVAKGSYGTNYYSGGNYYNFLYCYNASIPAFAIIAASKSGKAFAYSNGSVSESIALGGSAATCTTLGVTSPNTYWLYGQLGSNIWQPWV